ncbi:MAG: ankyrin repeat domain-containing protein [Isosphaeraceae bacterium]
MDRVRELLERGADVNQRDEDGSTPLDYAISDDDLPPELVGELLDRGAKPDATDEEGTTALMVAPTPLLPLLIAHGANVNARDRAGGTPLIQAASLGDVKRLEILLDHGAEIDATNGRSNALIAAVEAGRPTVRLPLARGRGHQAAIRVRVDGVLPAAASGDTDRRFDFLIKAGSP